MIRKIPDDSDRNYDIVHMLKKIAIGLESKNVDDLRAIAHELEAWVPHGNWSKLDVKTKVFVEHILMALGRLQLGFEILDKGAEELTNIRQKVENDEIHDVMDEVDHEDDFERKMRELVSEYDEIVSFASKHNMPGLAFRVSAILRNDHGKILLGGLYPLPKWDTDNLLIKDKALLYSISRQESGYNPRAKSYANALGVMQILPSTAAFIMKDKYYRYKSKKHL